MTPREILEEAVAVFHPDYNADAPDGFIVINLSDYDAATMTLFKQK